MNFLTEEISKVNEIFDNEKEVEVVKEEVIGNGKQDIKVNVTLCDLIKISKN